MAERMVVSLTGQAGSTPAAVVADPSVLGPLGALALAFLVTERHRPVTREELADVLWGEELPHSWEASLRSVISRVRRRLRDAGLPADVITGGRGGYQLRLPSGTVVDVEKATADLGRARGALSSRDVQAAVHLAQTAAGVASRRFLPGVGGVWVESCQAALDEVRLQALELLSEAATAASDHAGAVAAAEAVIRAQPLRESAHVRAMAAHAAAGNRGEALRAYERCRTLLAEELGVSPAAATEAAYLTLLGDGDDEDHTEPVTNLGAELSSFVGRSEELAAVRKALGGTRLLTLVGPGGVGKTRLAVRAAAEGIHRFRDGVWVVELAALADPALLPSHVLGALGLPEKPSASPTGSLRQHLGQRQMLLVLDNCEHLTAACAALVKDLLSDCRGLTVLATSREALGLPGEALCPVPPLPVPDSTAEAPDRLWDCDAVRLFVERASAADPTFSLNAENAPAVAQVCRSLDGLPLAIELAAARVRSLSVTEVAHRLRHRFRLLVGRDPTAPGRHRTLQAAVDWSYEALTPSEQSLFRTLSVFTGGFTLEAAEEVGGSRDDPSPPDVLEDLANLVDKSLVVADRSGATTRYRLLETLRQYGLERLAATGEENAVRARHLQWVCAVAEQAERHLEAGEQGAWLRRLDAEEDNVRAALEWSATHPGGDHGLRTAGALWRYWQVRTRGNEGRRWLRTLLDVATDAAPGVRAKALISSAILALTQTDAPLVDPTGVRLLFEEGLELRRRIGDQQGIASALHGLGGLHLRQGEAERARDCFEKTLAIGREIDDKRLVAASLTNLANIALQGLHGRLKPPDGLDAKLLYEESLPYWRELGDDFATARVLSDLAAVAVHQRRLEVARSLLRESADLQRKLEDRRGLAQTMKQLAGLATRQTDLAGARSLLEESLAIKRELQDPFLLATGLGELADLSLMDGDVGAARRLYEEAAAVARPLELRYPLYNALGDLGVVALMENRVTDARRLLDEAADIARHAPDLEMAPRWASIVLAVVALAEEEEMEAAELCRDWLERSGPRLVRPSFALALLCDVLAVLAAHRGELRRGALLWGAAEATRQEPTISVRFRPEFQRALATMRTGLGDQLFEQVRLEGAAITTEDLPALIRSSL